MPIARSISCSFWSSEILFRSVVPTLTCRSKELNMVLLVFSILYHGTGWFNIGLSSNHVLLGSLGILYDLGRVLLGVLQSHDIGVLGVV